MEINKKYLIISNENKNFPIIKIFENICLDGRKNVYISFLGTHHHYSLHESKIISETSEKFFIRQNNEKIDYQKNYTGLLPILFTSFDTHKESSVGDRQREKIAEALQLPNPSKHAKYYENRILPLGSMKCFPLGGRNIKLSQIAKKKEYPISQSLFLNSKFDSFYVETDFYVKKPIKIKGVACETSLGWLVFRIKKLSNLTHN